jgi:acetyl esterase/lipase
MRLFPVTLLLASLLALPGCASHLGRPEAPAKPEVHTRYQITRDVIYSPPNWPEALKADVYTPDVGARSIMFPPLHWPAVLLIHGGGWEGPDRRELMASIAERLAKRGYVVMNVSYRYAPQYQWPAPFEDLQEALKWLRAHAEQYGVRSDRVATFGYSAGGHLAALLGALGNSPETRVQAVVAGGTASDLRQVAEHPLVLQFLGGNQQTVPERYLAASPIAQIKPGDPPVFLYHGGMDSLVKPSLAEDYHRALDAAGVPNELYILRGRGHIGAIFTDGGAVDAALEFLDRWLR